MAKLKFFVDFHYQTEFSKKRSFVYFHFTRQIFPRNFKRYNNIFIWLSVDLTMWNVRLRGPRGKQVVLKIDPEASFKTFSELAVKELNLTAKDSPTFRKGFPPRPVEVDGSALVKFVFEANDTVVVDTSSSSAGSVQTLAAPSAEKKAAGRPKRAATKKPAPKPARGVHTLNPPTAKAKKKAHPKRKITGSGHQLGSSLENNPSTTETAADEDEPQHKYRRTKAINLTSKEDVEISLVNAVSGQSTGRAAKFFRAATKNALEHQYELTLATARETARKWKEETVDLLKTDELQAILKYVLLSGGETGREMLKPFNMAQVSTRVFWSIAHLYDGDVAAGLADLVPDADWSSLDTRTRVMSEKAMEAKANEKQYKLWKQGKQCHTRSSRTSPPSKPESEKEGKPAKRLATKETKPEVIEVDLSDAEEEQDIAEPKRKQTPAISAKEATSSTLRSAAAQAALARFDRNAQTSAVVSAFLIEDKTPVPSSIKKETANSDDERESEEEVEEATTVYCDSCKKARILSPEEAATAKLDKDPWTCTNLVNTGRSDGCDAVDDEVAQITGCPIAKWLQKAAITTRRELADASVGATMHALVNPLGPSAQTLQVKLENLIDEARLDEVNDWMSEIVGEDKVVQRLEVQKLGTPADLIATPSDLILEAVGNIADISFEVVNSWQTHAQRLVNKHPWLAEWRTL
ncbi:hypothetical protein PHMEG_000232 [Phytophthora megakarya]|uniref:ubiquitinyl hydrolase 1 n=1 Tax=Phytophthora megakarya TaxID=4795 RepID=A0A225X5T4_9STRA|nr:hypothetical protein PHMEG_000232 [Phytophthora megakarya]